MTIPSHTYWKLILICHLVVMFLDYMCWRETSQGSGLSFWENTLPIAFTTYAMGPRSFYVKGHVQGCVIKKKKKISCFILSPNSLSFQGRYLGYCTNYVTSSVEVILRNRMHWLLMCRLWIWNLSFGHWGLNLLKSLDIIFDFKKRYSCHHMLCWSAYKMNRILEF